MKRLALAIAYEGDRFDSYARQPGRRTVEGELVRLLRTHGVLREVRQARFASASRTDKGVSAAWNVVAFDSNAPSGAVAALTAKAPEGLHLLCAREVPSYFDPRHASLRTYRYFLDQPWDWKRVRLAAQLFRGRHDFSNFRRADRDKSPWAEIRRIRYRASAPGPWMEVEAPFFLWQQVRRIAACLQGVAEKKWRTQDVEDALENPERRVDFGVAKAEPLLLLHVSYDPIAFPEISSMARRRLAKEAAGWRRHGAWLSATRGKTPTVRR